MSRRSYALLAAVLVLASTLRLGWVALSLARDAEPVRMDGVLYDQLAMNLLQHGTHSLSTEPPYTPTAWYTPGWPLVLAGLYGLIGHKPVGALFLQVALGCVALLMTFRIAEALYGIRAGLCAAGLLAVDPAHVISSDGLLSDPLATTLLAAALAIWLPRAREGLSLGQGILVGAVLGFSTLVRPAVAPLAAVGVAYGLAQLSSKQWKPLYATGLALLSWIAIPGAWVARNALIFGVPAITSSGAQMMSCNHAKLEVLSRGGDELELMRHYNRELPADADLPPLDDPLLLGGLPIGERNELRYASAITEVNAQEMLDYPGSTIVRALAASLAAYLLGYGRGNIGAVAGPVGAGVAAGVWWSTLLLVFASPVLSRNVRRQWPSLLLMAMAIVVLFCPVLFMGYSRYRLPTDPILCVLAGATLSCMGRPVTSTTGGGDQSLPPTPACISEEGTRPTTGDNQAAA